MRFTFLILFAAAAEIAPAQTTFATITGIVTDPAGTVVPGAMVTAAQAESNYQYSTKSNATGNYSLAQLREGRYVLRVQAAGFKEFLVRDIELEARDIRRIDAKLELGTLETKIEVTAGATLIETETARISDTKTWETMLLLPLNARGLFDFLGLTVGVMNSTTTAQRRYAGSRNNQSDGSIDGITFSDMYGGNQISPIAGYIENYQEVRVDLANNTAEFGSIGNITIISKSGTNQLHGSLYDYYSSPWFQARNPFSPQRPGGVKHEPGGSVGGPVLLPHIYNGRNRTFFFFFFETTRGSIAQDLLTPTVPLPAWRTGDFSALAPATVVKDPSSNTPFPGNIIPASRINSVSQKLQDMFYPLPNYGSTATLTSQNYRELKSREFDPNTEYAIRIDHRFSDKRFLFGRWTWNRYYGRSSNALPALGQFFTVRNTRALALSETETLRPNLVNELRGGLVYNNFPRHPTIMGNQEVQSLGIQGLAPNLPDIQGILKVNFTGLGLTGITESDYRSPGDSNRNWQIQDHLSWFHGRHSVKVGMILTHVGRKDFTAPANLFGTVTFSNRFSGFPYADFLLGIPTTAARAYPTLPTDELRWAYDYFATDNFKLSSRLSLDLGVRYEYHPTLQETHGMLSMFDIKTGKIVVPDGSLAKVSSLMPRGYVDVVEAKDVGWPGKTLFKTDRDDVAPRIGLAYRPWGNDTVLRSGFGIFYDVTEPEGSLGGSPFVIAEPAYTNPTPTPTVIFPQVFPATSTGGPATVTLPVAGRTDLRCPYSMQYNFTIEHQRWSTGFMLAYIGDVTRQGLYSYNINQPLPGLQPFIQKPRMFPQYPAITYYTNGAGHRYNSLTAQAERHFGHGLWYQLYWVWARDLGDLERLQAPENAYNKAREWGVWQDIPTHRISGSVIYQLPFGKGKRYLAGGSRLARTVAGGWQVSMVYVYNSGQFLTPAWTGPDPVGAAYTTSSTPAQVTLRPDELHDPNLSASARSVNQWFDPTAFAPPQQGSYGNSARGVIKGPHSNVWHGGLAKYFGLGERAKLRVDIVANNLFNHANWSNPDTNISDKGQVGVITGIAGVAGLDESAQRAFRASIRVEW